MYLNKKILVVLAVIIVAVITICVFVYDYFVWDLPLQNLKFFPIQNVCDSDCKTELEKAGNNCVHLKEGFVCEEPRIIKHKESDVHERFITPVEYGQYYFIKNTQNIQLGAIRGLEIIDHNTVRITFSDVDSDLDGNLDSDFQQTYVLEKNQSFVGECFNGNILHVWTFTDVFELDGIQFAEFRKRLANIPENMECNTPQIIMHSIGISADTRLN